MIRRVLRRQQRLSDVERAVGCMQKEHSEVSDVSSVMEVTLAHDAVQNDKYGGGGCNSSCTTEIWTEVLLCVGGSDQSQRTQRFQGQCNFMCF